MKEQRLLKKSFLIVAIQVSGALLGLVSLYFIAGDMAPEVYSLVGVFGVISGITNTFTHLGVETTMMREALYWKERGNEEKVIEYTTQSVLSRIAGFLFLFPFLVAYIIFLNTTKYNGQYSCLLSMFLIGAFISSLNESMSLIVRSQGGYVFSQFARTLNSDVMKCLGLAVFFIFGSNPYLYFYSLSSLPLWILFYLKLRKSIKSQYIKINPMLKKIWDSRYLWLKSYMDYFKNYADGILVSIIFPASIMGSYSIFKTLENLIKNFIEGFFDVLSQDMVKYKGQYELLCLKENKFKKVILAVLAVVGLGTVVFSIKPMFFVELVHLSKYEGIVEMLYCVLLVAALYLAGKFEINALALFASSKLNFTLGWATLLISLGSFLVLFVIPTIEGALSQRIIVYLVITIISIVVFRKNRRNYYTKVLK